MTTPDAEPLKAQKIISLEAAERVVAAILRLGRSRETMYDHDFNIVPPEGQTLVTEAYVTRLGDRAGKLVYLHDKSFSQGYIRLEDIPEDADDPLAAAYRAAAATGD